VGLIGYVLGILPLETLHLDKKTAMTLVVPLVCWCRYGGRFCGSGIA
jgi:hypothetical protein